ncbi:nuclear cap binding protein subunit 2 [Guillardia theta]|uniref:Nuclear cap-binding protein subunit 2 n=1 Tax=Guillardia theta TaxID=55529 RepID=Q9AW50_GUITH|nr:nuclear cap binding protein subunit 2 [Guillardia theta]CAC27020.1 nuclear cap binding protein subunit 2 [Guillardia theta]
MKLSKTIYVGSLSKKLKENFLWYFFSRLGKIKRLIIGINNKTLLPCGFCFVEYFFDFNFELSFKVLSGFRIFNHFIKLDKDNGFKDNRQLSRKIVLE